MQELCQYLRQESDQQSLCKFHAKGKVTSGVWGVWGYVNRGFTLSGRIQGKEGKTLILLYLLFLKESKDCYCFLVSSDIWPEDWGRDRQLPKRRSRVGILSSLLLPSYCTPMRFDGGLTRTPLIPIPNGISLGQLRDSIPLVRAYRGSL